ncbi:protein starmaker-like, partial [Clarias magur]
MMDQSQTPGINHGQSEDGHDVLHLVDLSYVQSREDNSSLKKKTLLTRKRSYSTERKGSNERWRTETEEMHEWRHTPSSVPTPSLSPASSTSSLQHSLSEQSDLSVSTEIVIKKRRVENARRVRFSDVVTYVPPLVLIDDDGDADDEDYNHIDNTANDVPEEESPSRPLPVPRWIEALR